MKIDGKMGLLIKNASQLANQTVSWTNTSNSSIKMCAQVRWSCVAQTCGSKQHTKIVSVLLQSIRGLLQSRIVPKSLPNWMRVYLNCSLYFAYKRYLQHLLGSFIHLRDCSYLLFSLSVLFSFLTAISFQLQCLIVFKCLLDKLFAPFTCIKPTTSMW